MSDWNKKIYAHAFYKLQFEGYPDWDKPDGKEPEYVNFSTKKDVDRSSWDIAIETDDWCSGNFYFRDFTDSGLPFVNPNEVYRSCFIFQKADDAAEFKRRYNK